MPYHVAYAAELLLSQEGNTDDSSASDLFARGASETTSTTNTGTNAGTETGSGPAAVARSNSLVSTDAGALTATASRRGKAASGMQLLYIQMEFCPRTLQQVWGKVWGRCGACVMFSGGLWLGSSLPDGGEDCIWGLTLPCCRPLVQGQSDT